MNSTPPFSSFAQRSTYPSSTTSSSSSSSSSQPTTTRSLPKIISQAGHFLKAPFSRHQNKGLSNQKIFPKQPHLTTPNGNVYTITKKGHLRHLSLNSQGKSAWCLPEDRIDTAADDRHLYVLSRKHLLCYSLEKLREEGPIKIIEGLGVNCRYRAATASENELFLALKNTKENKGLIQVLNKENLEEAGEDPYEGFGTNIHKLFYHQGLLYVAADDQVYIWDPCTKTHLAPLYLPSASEAVCALAADDKRLYIGDYEGRITIYTLPERHYLQTINTGYAPIQSLEVDASGVIIRKEGLAYYLNDFIIEEEESLAMDLAEDEKEEKKELTIEDLPLNVFSHILPYLDQKSLVNLAHTSKTLRHISREYSQDQEVWKHLFQERFPKLYGKQPQVSNWFQYYQRSLQKFAPSKKLGGGKINSIAFGQEAVLTGTMKSGKFSRVPKAIDLQEEKVVKGFSSGALSVASLPNGRCFGLFSNGGLYQLDKAGKPTTPLCYHPTAEGEDALPLTVPSSPDARLYAAYDNLYIVYPDKMMVVPINSDDGRENPLEIVDIAGGVRTAFAFNDTHIFTSHNFPFSERSYWAARQAEDPFSGTGDNRGLKLHQVMGAIYDMHQSNGYLFIAADNRVEVIDPETETAVLGPCPQGEKDAPVILSGASYPIKALTSDANLLYTGDEQGFVKIWHIGSWQYINTLESVGAPITCLKVEEDELFIGTTKGIKRMKKTNNLSKLHRADALNFSHQQLASVSGVVRRSFPLAY